LFTREPTITQAPIFAMLVGRKKCAILPNEPTVSEVEKAFIYQANKEL
jgi:hypothetical protein